MAFGFVLAYFPLGYWGVSVMFLITKIPYVLLAIVAGNMVESGTLNRFSLGVAVVSMIAIISSGYQRLLSTIKTK